MKGVDSISPLTAIAPQLGKSYGFAGRRYSHDEAKIVGRFESMALHDSGLKIVMLFDDDADQYAKFNYNQASWDSIRAVDLARELEQPEGTPIYFAVDFDASRTQLRNGILTYFSNMAMRMAAARYACGVYGSALTCSMMQGYKKATYFWLANEPDWQGFGEFDGAHIEQGKAVKVGGLEAVACTSKADDFGAW